MKYSDGCIVQFARLPRLGAGKTRLIPSIGAVRALDLHCRLTERMLSRCVAAQLCPVQLWLDSDGNGNPEVADWQRRYGISVHCQQGADLGERMAHAVAAALREYRYLLVVGSDCPVLDGDYLESALARLADCDQHNRPQAVIGPAEDGGYVLFGLNRSEPRLFCDIDWGSDGVLAQTLLRLRQLNWPVVRLAPLWDVDHLQDLQRLVRMDADFAVNLPD